MVLLPGLATAAPPNELAQVHPAVWQSLEDQGEIEVLVILHQQADLRGAAALRAKEARGRHVYEGLRAVAEQSQRGLRAMLEARQAEYQAFYIVNALWVRADGALLQTLSARPEVERILPNPRVKGVPPAPPGAGPPTIPRKEVGSGSTESGASPGCIEPNLVRVHADEVWALGHTGQGVVVAGNDTGIEWGHPALISQYREQQPGYGRHDFNWHDAIAHQPVPYDDHSHGTHTLGTIVGHDGGFNQIGMAPGARWIGCKNMNGSGYGTPATYLECFEFFLAPYAVGGTPAQGVPELAPHVVNNSWACPPIEGCDPGTLEAAVAALRQAGILVVASAGNYGSACGTVSYPPAVYQGTFSVGAFDHNSEGMATFSSRGPVSYGGESYRKPDLTAPGVSIRSSLPGGAYGFRSGTSMAAPHVAGAAALLLSAAPGFAGDVGGIEQILTQTAEARTTAEGCGGDDAGDLPNNTWGWGILDARAAVVAGLVGGVVTDVEAAHPITAATVTAGRPTGPETATDATGHYALALPSGTYSLTAQATGYFSQTITHVTVISREITLQDFALTPWPRHYLPLVVRGP